MDTSNLFIKAHYRQVLYTPDSLLTLCDSLLKQAGHKSQGVTKWPPSSLVPKVAASYCKLDSLASDWIMVKLIAIVWIWDVPPQNRAVITQSPACGLWNHNILRPISKSGKPEAGPWRFLPALCSVLSVCFHVINHHLLLPRTQTEPVHMLSPLCEPKYLKNHKSKYIF